VRQTDRSDFDPCSGHVAQAHIAYRRHRVSHYGHAARHEAQSLTFYPTYVFDYAHLQLKKCKVVWRCSRLRLITNPRFFPGNHMDVTGDPLSRLIDRSEHTKWHGNQSLVGSQQVL
jgi:hypothetical protein